MDNSINNLRRQNHIHVDGLEIPHPISSFDSFSDLSIPKYLINNITKESKFISPTAVQMQAIPIMIAGRDLFVCSPTGTGKTLAFLIPMLTLLRSSDTIGFRCLIIVPTRELAHQIYREIKKITIGKKFKIFVLSKSNASIQNFSRSGNRDILITTPMRILHLIRKKGIFLDNLKYLIMDECDRLLEKGFLEQIDELLSACPRENIQNALFSATFPPGIETLARQFLNNPIRLVIGARDSAPDTVKQRLHYIGNESNKLKTFSEIIHTVKIPILVFVQTIERAKELYDQIKKEDIRLSKYVEVMHGERTQSRRLNIIDEFRTRKIWVLIATDLMARGIDFIGVNCVINYDFPQSTISYIHRIGRTGRAGTPGEAVTLFTDDDCDLLRSIANVMKLSGCEVPEWMLTMKKCSRKRKKELKHQGFKRDNIIKNIGKKKHFINKKRKEN